MSLGLDCWGTEREIWIGDNEIITQHKERVDPLLDQNQRIRNAGAARRNGMHHVASIPMTVFYKWKKEWKEHHADRWEWKTYLAMKVRDRDYDKLRTSEM